jgi:aquaporin NIP
MPEWKEAADQPVRPDPSPSLKQRLAAEFVGTFALVFAGTGAIAINRWSNGVVGHVGIAVTFGLVIGVMVYAYKDLSGAQFNPAVSVSLWLRGVFPGREVVPYVVVQLIASIVATGVLLFIVPMGEQSIAGGTLSLGATLPGEGVGAVQATASEAVTTFFLVTVILGVVSAGERGNPWAGIAIGGTVALCALFFGPLAGASMNPARSLGPAVFTPGALAVYWIYVVGPVFGGVTAVGVDILVRGRR